LIVGDQLRAILFGALLSVSIGRAVAGDVALPAPSAHVEGLPPLAVTVIEPSASQPLKPVEVTYEGYPVPPLLDQLLGSTWRVPGAMVGFESKDGYLSIVPGQRLQQYPAYLVFARARGGDFVIEVPPFNERVSLAPWYLVWDNILHPELRVDGDTYWPYQVMKVGLIDQGRLAKLTPPMLPVRYQEGAQLTLKYCLACHQVNGVGGRKYPLDLAPWAKGQSFARFATWVLDPSGKNPLTTMPALATERPAAERQLMARQIYGYLRAVGALGK
jgi:mono/diheme cytochrome c family protein